jgi:hypothetical protein
MRPAGAKTGDRRKASRILKFDGGSERIAYGHADEGSTTSVEWGRGHRSKTVPRVVVATPSNR